MKNQTLTLTILFLFSILTSQAQWGSKTIKGNGSVITKTIQAGDYDAISVAGNFYVTLIEGSEGTIQIKGESNLLEEMEIETEKGNLKIKPRDNKNLKTSGKNKIEITIPVQEINTIALAGSGTIQNDFSLKSSQLSVKLAGSGTINLDIKTIELETSVAGSGDLLLKGKAQNLNGSIAGSGSIDTQQVKTENADISIAGSGDFKLQCSGLLKARVSGSGDIIYKGKPEKIDSKVAGSGKLKSL
ncbi:head GIN domain-containing protein [uncultured Planktosalinus sp.]|uniref:head GIN domain-containing protein n=1 Tax=uncultured Planktosalinus sp. TaxID=1810935 RepID=UPI0030DA390A